MRLMVLSTSAVAVCCRSDLLSSRVRACTSSNSRTFSIAITAWSAKVFTRPICPSGEWPYFASRAADDAYRLPVLEDRNRHERPVLERPLKYLARARIVIKLSQDILELHGLALDECPTHDKVGGGGAREKTVKRFLSWADKFVEGHQV